MAMRAPASRDRDGAGVTSHKYLPISRLQRHAVSGGPDLVLVTVQWFRLLGLRITSGGCASAIAKGNSPESRADPARRPTTLSHELQRSLSPNSPSRARTCDLAVNSRSLYQLSYRGIRPKAKVTKRVLDNLDRSIGKEPDSNYFVKIYLGLPIQKNRRCNGQRRAHPVKWVVCVFCAESVGVRRCCSRISHPQEGGSVEELEEHGRTVAHLRHFREPLLGLGYLG